MIYAVILAALFAALIAVVTVVGYRLPERHRASANVKLQQPAERVWETISNFSEWPSWNRSIKSMTRQADVDGDPLWLMADDNGKLPSRVRELLPPQGDNPGRLRTEIADDSLPFGGTWTWEIVADADGGTSVTITEDGEIKNPIFRFMARYFFGYSATAEAFLKALSQKFGESAVPTVDPG